MKKLAVASVAALAITGLSVAPATAQSAERTGTTTGTSTTATSADANRSGADSERRKRCVTKREFRRAKRHMKMKRVHRIFGTRGKQSYVYTIGGTRYVGREYKACRHPRWSMVSVDFKRGRVTDKFAFWG